MPARRSRAAGPSIITPLSASRMREISTLVRTVSGEGVNFNIQEAGEEPPTFKCALIPPKTFSAPSSDISPRQWLNKFELFYMAKLLGQDQTVYEPGARFTIGEVEYEAVSEALSKRLAMKQWAWVQHVLPVARLYPLTATLVDLKGDPVPEVPSVPFSVWEPSNDRFTSRGRYDDTEGGVPPEFADAVKGSNLALVVNTRKYKITNAHAHFAQPHVQLRLVSTDA